MSAEAAGGMRRGVVYGLLLTAVVLVLDQASKTAVVDALAGTRRVIEVLPFLNIVMAWNPGVSFGLFSDAAGPWVLFGVAAVFSVVLLVWLWKAEGRLLQLALGLMIGGALGNAIDRVRWGAVADFIDFHLGGWHFWAFNVADSAITVGAVLLIADSLFRRES